MRSRLLIIDDKKNIRKVLSDILVAAGYEVDTASGGVEGIELFRSRSPDLVLTDLKMDAVDGIEVVRTIRRGNRWIPIILLTAYGSIPTAVEAMKAGADDFLTKPLDYDLLRAKIRHYLEELRDTDSGSGERGISAQGWSIEDLIGESSVMKQVKSMIRTVAESDSSVLIEGECGTGKELIARSLYVNSRRADGPFVVVDCSAIPEQLLESELFGYEKGAFTGAGARKPGRFEEADGGTLFLDEIGELPLGCQAKLLRVLQEKQLFRVGGREAVSVDFRLIAATNKRLRDEVTAGRFRSDLFYRLNVISIESPPLRERRKDLPLLIEHFWRKACAENRIPPREIAPGQMRKMINYDWPGNVRELKNCIARLALLDTLPNEVAGVPDDAGAGDSSANTTLSDFERDLVAETLARCGGNISQTARELGIGRKALYNRIRKYNLTVPQGTGGGEQLFLREQ